MKQALMFSQLSPSRQTLVRLCQSLNYGSILHVRVANGEVSLDPKTEVLLGIRLDDDAGARAELESSDFTLRAEVCRLLDQIDALKNGTIEEIVVHAGIPRRVTLRRPLSKTPQ